MSPELAQAFGWWQIAVCTFAFAALMAIWWHIGRKKQDAGQIWLALSILCWSFSGLAEITLSGQENGILLEGSRTIASLFNSLFILLALPFFKYPPERIKPLIHSRFWVLIIGVPFLFSLLSTIGKLIWGSGYELISELDVYYAFFTLIFLGGVIWNSFVKRRLPSLAVLSLICIGITAVAQILKLVEDSSSQVLFSAIFKTCLIMLFFALALSWVKELSENTIPASAFLSLKLFSGKNDRHQNVNYVELSGIPQNEQTTITLSTAPYELLLKFAKLRLSTENGWLEIKPKDVRKSSKTYDIKDYNELKRLLHALLDGIYGPALWSKEQHYIPLKTSLFEMSEKRDRKVRLKLLPHQIIVEKP